jgi:hypothetical protein
MKQLEKSDLIKNEVYKHQNGNLVKYQLDGDINGRIKGSYIGNNVSNFYKEATNNFTISYLKLATPEEKHWLEECIAANSFISYEEAVKTFVYKYYKIIENKISSNYNNNVIYSRNTIFGHFNGDNRIIKKIEIGKHCCDSTIDVLYGEIGEQKVCFDMKALQPSTKEAYDAQFVVKEPEFVLPEKWFIRRNINNFGIINRYFKNKFINDHGPISSEGVIGTNGKTWFSLFDINVYTEITFDQFKKYVLKKQLKEPKDKVLDYHSSGAKIKKVESSEGAIFELGDKITVFTKDSLNKGRVLTIKDFRWNNAKTDICAITEVHAKNGIGLDKIELYSEPVKKELSLLEQAKLKYPIGTKVKSLFYNTVQGNIININFKSGGIWANLNTGQGIFLYSKRDNKWAEIVDDFKLPENWCVRGGLNVCEVLKSYFNSIGKNRFDWKFDNDSYVYFEDTENVKNRQYPGENQIEITFEQFKKYVLKDE